MTPPAVVLPVAPLSLSAVSVSPGVAKLTWVANPKNTSYNIQAHVVGGLWSNVTIVVGANVSSYTATGLLPSKSYQFRIQGVNANGVSVWVNSGNTAVLKPVAPSRLDAKPDLPGKAKLSWTSNQSNTSYKIYKRLVTGVLGPWQNVATVGNVASYSAAGLVKGKSYEFEVQAVNANGSSVVVNSNRIVAK